MRAVIFSDIHVHAWPAYARLDEEGRNDRLMDTLDALRLIGEIAVESRADCILFGGDFFHVPKLDAEVIHLAAKTLEEMPADIPILAIEGNHDQASRARDLTSVGGLRVPSQWRWLRGYAETVAGMKIWGTPYGSSDVPTQMPDVAILHRGVSGAVISDYFHSAFEDDLKLEDAKLYAKRLVICGHYHKAQVFDGKPKVLIPGSPLQHTWGDAGQDRGVWLATINPGETKLEFMPLDLPKFVKVGPDGGDDIGGNFVEVDVTGMDVNEVKILRIALDQGARGYSIGAAPPEVSRPAEDRMVVPADLESAVRAYAKKFGGDEDLGVALVRRARKEA